MSCSENWSEESDHDDDEQEESSGGGGSKVRCYECTFCKRGFTNAQALGGHMNIHRKDRAKAKQITPPKPTSSTSNSNSNKLLLSISNNNNNNTNTTEEYSLLPSPFVSAQYQQYYSILESHTNYNMYFHHPSPTAPNPRNLPPPPMPMKQPQQELLGPNLSLQIGPTTHLHRTPPIHNDAAELDLELRLGHHHPY